jgi:hypothetical protein
LSDLSEVNQARVAWRAALIAALMSAVGFPIDLLICWQLPHASCTPQIVASLLSAGVAAALLHRRERTRRNQASVAFLIVSAIVAWGLWTSNAQFAAQADFWVPFQANKLGVLTVALLMPELWVGLLSIGAYAGSAFAQWWLLEPGARDRAAAGEPWAMLAYATFAAILLVQGRRRFRIERNLARAQQEAASLEQLARTLLAIRDFANTPLQTITSIADRITLQQPWLSADLAPLQRALGRLRELNQLLSHHESRLQWRPGEESFDARRVLEWDPPRPERAARRGAQTGRSSTNAL